MLLVQKTKLKAAQLFGNSDTPVTMCVSVATFTVFEFQHQLTVSPNTCLPVYSHVLWLIIIMIMSLWLWLLLLVVVKLEAVMFR